MMARTMTTGLLAWALVWPIMGCAVAQDAAPSNPHRGRWVTSPAIAAQWLQAGDGITSVTFRPDRSVIMTRGVSADILLRPEPSLSTSTSSGWLGYHHLSDGGAWVSMSLVCPNNAGGATMTCQTTSMFAEARLSPASPFVLTRP